MEYEEAKRKSELEFIKKYVNPIQRAQQSFGAGFAAGCLFEREKEQDKTENIYGKMIAKYEGQIKINHELAKQNSQLKTENDILLKEISLKRNQEGT